MVKKPTIILFILLAILFFFAWFIEFFPAFEGRKSTPTKTEFPRPLANWEFMGIKSIEYRDREGKSLNLYRGKEINSWSFDETPSIPVSNGIVLQLMSELLTIKPNLIIPSADSDGAMGFGEQVNILTLTDLNENKIEIHIGTETPTKSGTYIKIDSEYYIVNTPVIMNIEQLLSRERLIDVTEQPSAENSTPQP